MMTTLPRVRRLGVLAICLASLVACSNGRGSLDDAGTGAAEGEFTIGATVSGLVGSGLILQNNGTDDVDVSADGAVTFATLLAGDAAYNVTVLTQPVDPVQTCAVANGTGRVAGADVTNVTVTCTTVTAGSFALGGSVTGLEGSGLVLQNNAGDDLPIPADGGFTFATAISTGETYDVTVLTQPSDPAQTCTVANGTGTMGGSDVTNVTVTCAAGAFSIGGIVAGLEGSGLQLQNNGTDDLSVTADGTFVFAQPIASGGPYNVTVKTQPSQPLQTCTVRNAAGTVDRADVSDVMVSCATDAFTVGGTVGGLAGSGLVLQLNGANDRAITTDGAFAFPTALASGTPYVVSVETQPINPTQVCTIANGAGIIVAANVTNIAVTCTTATFSIGGRVSGLDGSGLVLQNNGADDLEIASNGRFTFETEQASGSSYEVTVLTQPGAPSQTCTIANGQGLLGGANVRDVLVSCATDTFTISGTVSGLMGTGLVLQNNGGDDVGVDADGGFAFPTAVASGAAYEVTVRTQPSDPTQVCSVASGSGNVGSSAITDVAVSCTTSEFTIGGMVSGLAGSGLLLRNNDGDDLRVDSEGSFTFATPLQSGGTYDVEIAIEPTHPTQACTLENGSGIVGGANVTDITIRCVTTQFTIGGTVSGLSGSGLELRNNGADPLPIAANGAFVFPASLPSGTPYSVTVTRQPINPLQLCLVAGGSGTVADSNVTDIAVSCTTLRF